jgi:hypothetical protein
MLEYGGWYATRAYRLPATHGKELPAIEIAAQGGCESAHTSATNSPRYAAEQRVACACTTLQSLNVAPRDKVATPATTVVVAGSCTCNAYAMKGICVHFNLLLSLWTSPNAQLPFRVVPPPKTAPLAAASQHGETALSDIFVISKRAEASLLSPVCAAAPGAVPEGAVSNANSASPPAGIASTRPFASTAVSPWKVKPVDATDDVLSGGKQVFTAKEGTRSHESAAGETNFGHAAAPTNDSTETPSRSRSFKATGSKVKLREVSLDVTPPASRAASRLPPRMDEQVPTAGAAAISGAIRKRSEFDFDEAEDVEIIAVTRPNVSTRAAMGILTRPRGRGTGKRGRGRGNRVTFA